jgi:hypothetical protein
MADNHEYRERIPPVPLRIEQEGSFRLLPLQTTSRGGGDILRLTTMSAAIESRQSHICIIVSYP